MRPGQPCLSPSPLFYCSLGFVNDHHHHTHTLYLSISIIYVREEKREAQKTQNLLPFFQRQKPNRNHHVFSLPSLSPSLLPLHPLLLQPLLNHPTKPKPSSLSPTKTKEEEEKEQESFSRHYRKINPSSLASLSFLLGTLPVMK